MSQPVSNDAKPAADSTSTTSDAGFVVAFEGVDGSGKSSVVAELLARLRADGVDVVHARHPGGTAHGKRLRALLVDVSDDDACEVTETAEAMLMAADLANVNETVVRPAAARGAVVLQERCSMSCFYHEARDVDPTMARACHHFAEARPPDLIVLLDVPFEVAANRLAAAEADDRVLRRGEDYLRRVDALYASVERRWYDSSVVRVDANRPLARVVNAVHKKLVPHVDAHHADAPTTTSGA